MNKKSYLHLFIVMITLFVFLQGNLALAISEKKKAQIGKEMYDKIIAEMPIYQAQKLNDYVSGIGQKLVKYSDQPKARFTFTIIDSPEINAFATPGGYIYVNRGLLAYMNSEAQLAAVLSHEIAHVTADHASRQKRAQISSNVVAGVLAILTRSAEVGEASAMWGAATVKGYGRDMELEADAVGAKFMARAGYPVDAMITIISQLKDHERFMKKRNTDSGKKVQSYHGIFSSHPRNDKRLNEMVKQSGSYLDSSKTGERGIAAFRVATQHLPWGQTSQTPEQRENRYYDRQLNFSFDYPQGWQFKQQGKRVLGESPDKSATLTLDIKARTLDSPEQFIKKSLGINFIKKSEAIVIARLKGHTGVVPNTEAGKNNDSESRLAVIYYGRGAYIFRGDVYGSQSLTTISSTSAINEARAEENQTKADKSAQASPQPGTSKIPAQTSPQKEAQTQLAQTYDKEFKSIIASFRPRQPARQSGQGATITYVKANSSATYAKLARQLNLGKYGKDQLQLINGHYPGGEPRAGQWIKIIR